MLHVIPHAVFLHVEDNPDEARLFRDALARVTANIRIRRVSSAETALGLMPVPRPGDAGPPFDCVVSRLRLPGRSGQDLARALRQRYDAATLPLVAVTHDVPAAAETPFDAVYQKAASVRAMEPVAHAIVDLWFSQARRFHC
ncbi:hypothetical protein [Stappia sp.]|uniref:response regulator n=1 Tax=Stappia sp. TaxID=1870903 RepID=UPI0032D95CC0